MDWISVKDKFPERLDVVLVYDIETDVIWKAYFDTICGEWKSMEHFRSYLENITHWMPLPDPPKEVS